MKQAKKTLVDKAVAEMLYSALQRLSSDNKSDFNNFDHPTRGTIIRNKIMDILRDVNNNWSYRELFDLDEIVQMRTVTSPHPWPEPLEIAPIIKNGDIDLLKTFMLQYTAEKNQVLVDHYAKQCQKNKDQPTFIKIKKVYEIFLKTKPSMQIETEELKRNGIYTHESVCCMPFTEDSKMLQTIQNQNNKDFTFAV